ncbi:hypothetical protein P691DRAFT_768704 [Macrolepiota fuliginosa MF-IS2]|uniref:Uncharacterized protein n=1 Tax=Macrolepiota fuliginosa MF-IS2 TaxID=1400762 RepID=A0A9P6BVY1_9AGAR|nr:hypothetical protein P691DRAFT_768704 [Macrolepiota fuliginosa MF-IS2]
MQRQCRRVREEGLRTLTRTRLALVRLRFLKYNLRAYHRILVNIHSIVIAFSTADDAWTVIIAVTFSTRGNRCRVFVILAVSIFFTDVDFPAAFVYLDVFFEVGVCPT